MVLRPSQKHIDCDIQVSIHADNHLSSKVHNSPRSKLGWKPKF